MYGPSSFEVMVRAAVARHCEDIREAAWRAGFRAGISTHRGLGFIAGFLVGVSMFMWLSQ